MTESHKRNHSQTDTASEKRQKSSIADDKRLVLSTEVALKLISFDGLKLLYMKVLADERAGPVAKSELRAAAEVALVSSRAEAAEACEALIDRAIETACEVKRDAILYTRKPSRTAWPEALSAFFSDVEGLLKKGHLVNCPELA
ncbi:Uu.00g039760.m01.CDS01 [Anthostomella pinea]|uniref:Uu.00g039760.m01.CDS01 n=1 Tax=Anthostomella pinea TaxID=933095 RepID=A0AAI8YE03_9PEZI|nr:Uu.00g039760.m01.CDS01 [Anthostomella pinea]